MVMHMNDYILDYLFQNPTETFWMEQSVPEVVAKAVSALANSTGGSLVIGAEATGVIPGVTEQEIELIIKGIAANVRPFPPFTTSITERDGKIILIVNVWAGNSKPYICYDAYYVRENHSIRKASLEEITRISSSQNEIDDSWERRYVPGVEISDLTGSVLESLKRRLIEIERVDKETSVANVLMKMGLMNGNHVTNAGVVLFAKTPSIFLPQTRIRVSVYGGVDDTQLLDVRLYDTNLISAIDEIVGYISSLYRQTISVDGLYRQEKQELPQVALREGVLNAVVHRVYKDYDSYVAINVYSSRLEIVNSGELYGNLKVEDLSKTHQSVLRNPDIANALYTMRYIEMAGSGTLRIIEECRKNGNALPQWRSEGGFVTLVFPGVQHSHIAMTKSYGIEVGKLASEKSVQKALEQILNYMQTRDKVKLPEIADLIGKSYSTAKRYMKLLTDAEILEYEGNLRSGGWKKNSKLSI